MTTKSIQTPVLLVLCMLLAPVSSVAQQLSSEDREIDAPLVTGIDAESPLISLQADNVPIGNALKDICRKARWGLVLDADETLLAQPVTVLLPQKKPAARVLEMLLMQKGLQATLDDGVLRVAALPQPEMDEDTSEPNPEGDAVAEKTPDTDSREIVIEDISQLKDLKKRLKSKMKKHRDRPWENDDSGVERVEMGAPVVIGAGETVSKAVSIGDDVTVSGTVEREAVSVGGNVVVNSGATVGQSVAAVGGDVLVKKGATVNGEVVAVGGKVTVEDGATVTGDRVSVNIPVPALSGVAGVLGMGAMFWVMAAIFRSIVILAVALIIIWLAPQRVTIAKDYLVKKTGWSLLSGFLILLGTIPAIVFLAITIIGVPLIPFLILLLIAIVIFGLAALLLWLGNWIPLFKNRKSPTGAIVIGFIVFLLINMIPVLGGIFLLFASLAAAGATFLSRFGKASRAL